MQLTCVYKANNYQLLPCNSCYSSTAEYNYTTCFNTLLLQQQLLLQRRQTGTKQPARDEPPCINTQPVTPARRSAQDQHSQSSFPQSQMSAAMQTTLSGRFLHDSPDQLVHTYIKAQADGWICRRAGTQRPHSSFEVK